MRPWQHGGWPPLFAIAQGGRFAALGLIAILPMLEGCGSTAPPAPATVRGIVSFQGRPLLGGVIVFAPDRDRGTPGKPLSTTIGEDGTFQLTAEGSPTISPGWYRVAISDAPGSWPESDGYPRFPAALRRPDRSGLEREIETGKENVFAFHIEVPEDSPAVSGSR